MSVLSDLCFFPDSESLDDEPERLDRPERRDFDLVDWCFDPVSVSREGERPERSERCERAEPREAVELEDELLERRERRDFFFLWSLSLGLQDLDDD